MWLINTDTLQLEFFVNPPKQGVRYAILSHTWGEGEVSFQQFADLNTASQLAGYAKIYRTCTLARDEFGLNYAWVDTCCIDKSSSSELSEAINSMFAWYRDSTICLAFLSDLQPSNSVEFVPPGLERCRWFRRGWTLQELLAPRRVEFYDGSWNPIGSKNIFQGILEKITGIPSHILGGDSIETILVGNRMRWAAMRETTRTEDMAYCLLGIFGINMPLLYGEGDNAFFRLQEEICKQTNDMSLFAWTANTQQGPLKSYENRGVFASHPFEFHRVPDMLLRDGIHSQEITHTSKCVKFENIELLRPSQDKPPILPLGLVDQYDDRELGIYVSYTSEGYIRPLAETLATVPYGIPYVITHDIPLHDVYVSKKLMIGLSGEIISRQKLRLQVSLRPFHRFEILEAAPSSSFDYAHNSFYVPHARFLAGLYMRVSGVDLVIIFLVKEDEGKSGKKRDVVFDISTKDQGALMYRDWRDYPGWLRDQWARHTSRAQISVYVESHGQSFKKGENSLQIQGTNLRFVFKPPSNDTKENLYRSISVSLEEIADVHPYEDIKDDQTKGLGLM